VNKSGGNLILGSNVTIGGDFTISSGSVSALSTTMTVGGNWTNAGTFTAGTGTVIFNGPDPSTISGNNTFYKLTCVTPGKVLKFTAGSTQAVANALTLTGSAGNPVFIMSTQPGSSWSINPQLTRDISYTDVRDSNNTNTTDIDVSGQHCMNSGNNTKWTFGAPDNFTWTGLGADELWSTAANWQAGVPGAGDIAIFSSAGTKNCTIDVASVGGILIGAGYSSAIQQTTALGLGSYVQAGGVFT
jgi:hypothetical protein